MVCGGHLTHGSPVSLSGKVAVEGLERFRLTANKKPVPYDPERPTVTSGIRFGTPAGTSRGFYESDFRTVGELILTVLQGVRGKTFDAHGVREKIRHHVETNPVTP